MAGHWLQMNPSLLAAGYHVLVDDTSQDEDCENARENGTSNELSLNRQPRH
jgi:hypothetical protein